MINVNSPDGWHVRVVLNREAAQDWYVWISDKHAAEQTIKTEVGELAISVTATEAQSVSALRSVGLQHQGECCQFPTGSPGNLTEALAL